MMHVWSEIEEDKGVGDGGVDAQARTVRIASFWGSERAFTHASNTPAFPCKIEVKWRKERQLLTCTCLTIPMSLAFEGWSGGRTSTANASAMIATTRGKLVNISWRLVDQYVRTSYANMNRFTEWPLNPLLSLGKTCCKCFSFRFDFVQKFETLRGFIFSSLPGRFLHSNKPFWIAIHS